MCGFTGFTNHIENPDKTLSNMMDTIIHRGPDSSGQYTDDNIALGFRRLSIIDLKQGDQPIFNEDNSKILLFNGEIYNYKSIRDTLISKGHIFKTNSDSEVILHGYEQFGESILNMLRGMFAFVIWDKNKKELFGARDFFGIKPLYYSLSGESFLFGSEIKSFIPHPHFKKELNTRALESYLSFQYSAENETFFKNVFRLPPAHCFLYKNNNLEVKRYWEISFNENEKPSLEEWVNKISDTFHDSVNAHKIADVEVGSFLSSGVDSSYVAAVADVDKTFTVGFGNDEKYNEISWAKDFSKAIGKKNISKVISAEEYWNSLSKIQYHMDEPLADPAAVALYFVCNLASEYLKVVLSGEGADEIFGGYNVYSEPNGTFYDKLPMSVKRTIGKAAQKLPAKRGVNFFIRKGQTIEERFIGNANIFSETERKKLLRIKTDAPSPQQLTKPYYDKVADKDEVTKMQYLDLHMWMTGDILLKADKMSMANSLELRVPFLDKEIMALAQQIPTKYRVTHKQYTDNNTKYITKYAMRLAAKKDTPPQTAKTAEKKKLGFPVPIRVWLKQDEYYNKVKNAFTSDTSKKYFNEQFLINLLDSHKEGKADNSRKIWTVYSFLVWHSVFFETDRKG